MLHDTVKHKQLIHFVLQCISVQQRLCKPCLLADAQSVALQMGKKERPRPLDDPTRPYITFDIVAHLDSLSSHEGKRVSHLRLSCPHLVSCSVNIVHATQF